MGRWTSADPSGFPDGVNRSLYVNNAPLRGVDPLGLREANRSILNSTYFLRGGDYFTVDRYWHWFYNESGGGVADATLFIDNFNTGGVIHGPNTETWVQMDGYDGSGNEVWRTHERVYSILEEDQSEYAVYANTDAEGNDWFYDRFAYNVAVSWIEAVNGDPVDMGQYDAFEFDVGALYE